LEYLIHYSLEGGQTIGETKVHYKQLKEASVHVEHCLSLIALLDMDIIVSLAHIELGEIAHALKVMD
jgi:phosphoribosyl-dephospho-CoA transferase